MNSLSRKVCFLLLSAAVVFAGCTKKPRPIPADTSAVGAGNEAVTPQNLGNLTEPGTVLQPRPPGYEETADTIRGALPSVYFDFDRSAIKAGERSKINAAADYLKQNPQYKMLLEGHCDWRGTAEYNLGLGDRRSQAVKQFLATLGMSADRVQILSKGSLGATEKGTEDQMAKDRRVDFVILKH